MGLFSDDNKRHIKKLDKMAKQVIELEPVIKLLSDEQLKDKTAEFKDRLNNGATLDDIMYEAFAVVREASWRVLGMKHFFVQIMGGICLHQGRIAEMSTGEGKTLSATLPAYLNALSGNGVHVVTVNDYLAKRDTEWMGKIYNFLGMSVGVNLSQLSNQEKKQAYNSDITYGTSNEFGFDYLRDNLEVSLDGRVQRKLNFAIVDEVDSILIDEARTPLIISGRGEDSSQMYMTAQNFIKSLKPEDYEINEEDRRVRLLDGGVEKAERFFNVENLSDVENTEINHHLNQALQANFIFKRDKDYIVNSNEVFIVDENTGRVLAGRRYSEGLHQAIEAKERVTIQSEQKTHATITLQNYFRMYSKLSGMTGTAKTEEAEFNKIYNLDVVTIPTNLEMVRIDYNDHIYVTKEAKQRAIITTIEELQKKGQPVLVGTATVESSEEISRALKRKLIPHNVLNAKNHENEAFIIAQAGRKGQVTIATNMAGRGTDILLGGNPEYMAKQRMKTVGFSDKLISAATSYYDTDDKDILHARNTYKDLYNEHKKITDAEKQEVINCGGLFILGTERHESRRIDNQLRGRAGRQGDPGSSVFFISTEDDLLRIFGGDTMRSIMLRLNMNENDPVENKLLSKTVENAQKRLESKFFSMRKNVIQYDDVINYQRKIIYDERNKVLQGENMHQQILEMFPDVICDILAEAINPAVMYNEWDIKKGNSILEERLLERGTRFLRDELVENYSYDEIKEKLIKRVVDTYQAKYDSLIANGEPFDEIERVILLRNIDTQWMDHIDMMNQLKDGIGLRSYAQQDPVAIYKKEGFDMFEEMTKRIKEETVLLLSKITPSNQDKFERRRHRTMQAYQQGSAERGKQTNNANSNSGRPSQNAPCPCGSRKKYKHCCGKNN